MPSLSTSSVNDYSNNSHYNKGHNLLSFINPGTYWYWGYIVRIKNMKLSPQSRLL